MKSFGGISEFIAVVEHKSFIAAAQTLGISASGVSKAITRLECRLGTRLLQRTTRALRLTNDGAVFYQRCHQLVVGLQDAEQAITHRNANPRGQLTIELPRAIGTLYVMPHLGQFACRYPDLSVHAVFKEQYEDSLDEFVDLSIRLAGQVHSRESMHRIGDTRYVTCAAPKYLELHGMPEAPNDLLSHNCLGVLSSRTARSRDWVFSQNGTPFSIAVNGSLAMSSSEGLIEAARKGAGIIQLLDLVALSSVREGSLIPILTDWVAESRGLTMVCASSKQLLPKVRLFQQFASELFAPSITEAAAVFKYPAPIR